MKDWIIILLLVGIAIILLVITGVASSFITNLSNMFTANPTSSGSGNDSLDAGFDTSGYQSMTTGGTANPLFGTDTSSSY